MCAVWSDLCIRKGMPTACPILTREGSGRPKAKMNTETGHMAGAELR